MLSPRSRDNARTPYQWDGSRNAGFTAGMPWIRLNPCYPEINLKKDREDPDGVFRGYQELIRLRKEHPVIPDGDLHFYLEEDPRIIAYTRGNEQETLLVLANLSGEDSPLELPAQLTGKNWELLFSGRPEAACGLKEMRVLEAWQSAVFLLVG